MNLARTPHAYIYIYTQCPHFRWRCEHVAGDAVGYCRGGGASIRIVFHAHVFIVVLLLACEGLLV